VQHFEVEWKQISIPLHNLHLSTRIFPEIKYNINTNVNNKANTKHKSMEQESRIHEFFSVRLVSFISHSLCA